MGGKVDFAVRRSGATMPGRHSDDQVRKVKTTAAPSFFYIFCLQGGHAAAASREESSQGGMHVVILTTFGVKWGGGCTVLTLQAAAH